MQVDCTSPQLATQHAYHRKGKRLLYLVVYQKISELCTRYKTSLCHDLQKHPHLKYMPIMAGTTRTLDEYLTTRKPIFYLTAKSWIAEKAMLLFQLRIRTLSRRKTTSINADFGECYSSVGSDINIAGNVANSDSAKENVLLVLRTLLRKKIAMDWTVFLEKLSISGSARFPTEQYYIVFSLRRTIYADLYLSTYSTIRFFIR